MSEEINYDKAFENALNATVATSKELVQIFEHMLECVVDNDCIAWEDQLKVMKYQDKIKDAIARIEI